MNSSRKIIAALVPFSLSYAITNYSMQLRSSDFKASINPRTTYIHDDPLAVFVRLHVNNAAMTSDSFVVSISLIENKTPEEMRDLLSLVDYPASLSIASVPIGTRLTMGILKNAAGKEVRVFRPDTKVELHHTQSLFPGIPFSLSTLSEGSRGLRQLFTYITQGPELYLRMYDKSRQEQREGWVFAFRHAAGLSDEEVAERFSFLGFATPHACNVVVPPGKRVTGWAFPTDVDPYIFEIEVDDDVEFIDDRPLYRA